MTQRIENIRKSMGLLDIAFNHKKNVVKLSKANTLIHETAKYFVCMELLELGKDFITEAILNTGHRADILVIPDAEIIEILHTEKEDNPAKEDYPLPVIKLNAEQVVKQWKSKLY